MCMPSPEPRNQVGGERVQNATEVFLGNTNTVVIGNEAYFEIVSFSADKMRISMLPTIETVQ